MDTRWTVCSYHFWSQYTVPCSDPSLLSILSQHIIIPEVSVLFVESRSFFSHISALLLSNFVATDVYALSLKISKSLPAVYFPFLVWAKFWVPPLVLVISEFLSIFGFIQIFWVSCQKYYNLRKVAIREKYNCGQKYEFMMEIYISSIKSHGWLLTRAPQSTS